MKAILLMLMIAVAGVLPAQAQDQVDAAPAASGSKHPIMRGLLRAGARAVQKRLEGKNAKAQQSQAGTPVGEDEQPQQAVTPRAEPMRLLQDAVVDQLVEGSLSGAVHEVKEHYKAEARSYARQLGDVIAQRILSDPKVKAALQMLKVLAWGLVVYLTLVTLALLRGLSRVQSSNRRIIELLEQQRRAERS